LKKHEEELIQRVAELKAEQVDLKNKREKVLTVRAFFLHVFKIFRTLNRSKKISKLLSPTLLFTNNRSKKWKFV